MRVSGIGSWPGAHLQSAAEEVVAVLGALPFLPQLASVPGQDMISTALGESSPWRLPKVALAEQVQVALCGPCTLAHVTDMSLAQAVEHLVRRLSLWLPQLPDNLCWRVQLDEPMLTDGAAVADVLASVEAPTLVHTCQHEPDITHLRLTRADAVALDLTTEVDPAWASSVADLHLSGDAEVWCGVIPTTGPLPESLPAWVATMLKQRPSVMTPACGLGLSSTATDAQLRLAEVRRLADREARAISEIPPRTATGSSASPAASSCASSG